VAAGEGSRMMILPATHGVYMMADFDGSVDENLITLQSGSRKFLH
jgi:hypothetical protein